LVRVKLLDKLLELLEWVEEVLEDKEVKEVKEVHMHMIMDKVEILMEESAPRVLWFVLQPPSAVEVHPLLHHKEVTSSLHTQEVTQILSKVINMIINSHKVLMHLHPMVVFSVTVREIKRLFSSVSTTSDKEEN